MVRVTDKEKRPPPPEIGGGSEAPPRKAPGKKTRTAALPATGERTDRLRIERKEYDFGLVEIGKSETEEVRVKNTSKDFVSIDDFWVSLGQSAAGPRDGSEFSIAGASRDDIAPSGIASLPVTFAPKAMYPQDQIKAASRSGNIALLDEDGATAGSIHVRGRVRPPSKETVEAAQMRKTGKY